MRYVDKGSHSAKNLSGTCSLYPSIGSQFKSPGSGFDDKKPESNLHDKLVATGLNFSHSIFKDIIYGKISKYL